MNGAEEQVSHNLPPLALAARLKSNLLYGPLIYVATALYGCASLLASLFDKDGRRQHRIARAWAQMLLRLAHVPVRIVGAEYLVGSPVAVYACNHLSYMDTPVVFASLPFQFRILARHDLWKLPFIGWHLNRSGQIPVNADNPRASISSLNRGVKALQAGMPLFVFPEGGRSKTGQLQPFMSGPAFMAVRAGVPLVPMALIGTHELLPMHTRHLRPGPVTVAVGASIRTEGYTTKQMEALTERLRLAIEELYYAHAGHANASAAQESLP